MSTVDYLTEFVALLPPDQKFICLSFVTDKENKTTLTGIRFGGAFATYEAACEQAKKLQSVDQYFNVYVGEGGKWLPFDPNPDSPAVKDSQYADEQLNTMMKSYMENQEKAKVYHEQRKQELVRQNILENLQARHENVEELNKKLKKAKKHGKSEEATMIEQNLQSIEEQIKKMEEKKSELDEQIETLSNQVKAYGSTQGFNPNGPSNVNL
jgi:DNA repair exonuclease SbcCD ATPase subunit